MFKELPNTWGSDSLTAHIDGAIDNIAATVAKNSAEYSSLNKVDSCYNSIVGGLINPPGFLEGLFLMRAHVAFRASCMLAMSGHSPETFPVLRSCLENALYALHINQNKGLDDLWLRRHDNPSMEKKVRAEFSYRNVIKTLETVDAENHKVAVSLYQRAIDYGAHPNERSMI
ncbi:MAG: hypothetical protein KKA36_09570, partial [Gammaproteobacteria bacterium]|nr:hypothetical protein [Gammaproteobacteria bacterium]